MTTATRQVRFAPMRLDGSGAPSIAAGYYAIEPTSAYDDGTGRVEQLSLQVTVDGAAVTVDLPVTTTSWALKVTGTLYSLLGNRVTVEYVAVPAGSAIVVLEFENLNRLDPTSLGPTAPDGGPVLLLVDGGLSTGSPTGMAIDGGASTTTAFTDPAIDGGLAA